MARSDTTYTAFSSTFTVRHRRSIVVLALVFMALAGAIGGDVQSQLKSAGFDDPNAESAIEHEVPPVDLLSAPETQDRASMERQLEQLAQSKRQLRHPVKVGQRVVVQMLAILPRVALVVEALPLDEHKLGALPKGAAHEELLNAVLLALGLTLLTLALVGLLRLICLL